MMSFCKTLHTLLGLPDADDRRNRNHRCRNIPPPDRGGLRLLAGEAPRPAGVIESSAVIGRPPPPPPPSPPADERAPTPDPGAWGLREVAGVGICTESLGSESCESAIEIGRPEIDSAAGGGGGRWRRSRWSQRRRRGEFPPPLPWLDGRDGRRSRYMRGERRDGRLVLTEIKIERPEILRASRQDGRLRLQLVDRSDGPYEEAEMEEEAEELESEGRWGLPSPVGGMRCQEAVSGNGMLPPWGSHRFVTTA